MKLYDYFRSTASFRVRIALHVKQLDYQAIPIHLVKQGGEQFSKHYQAINPQNLVPTLVENDISITQSLAIIDYLEEVYPTPALLPSTPVERAKVRAFALAIAADIHPLNNLRVLNYLTHSLNVTEAQKKKWYQHWVALGFQALEQQLVDAKQEGGFCFGDQLSLADLCLVPQMYNARRFDCDLSAYPHLVHVDKQCSQLQAVIDAWPDEVPSTTGGKYET